MPSYHDVERYFLEEEKVLKEWVSKEWDGIYGTQYRIFFVKEGIFSKKLIEVSYNHISSIEFCRVRPKDRVIGAVICFILSIFIYLFFGNYGYGFYYGGYLNRYVLGACYFLIFLGIVLFIWFMLGIRKFMIHVNGRKPITVSKELSELIKYVRMRSVSQ